MLLLSPTTPSSSAKRHFACDICTDEDGGHSMCLNEKLWYEYLNSRRHRVLLKSREKKAAFEAWKQLQIFRGMHLNSIKVIGCRIEALPIFFYALGVTIQYLIGLFEKMIVP